jgi:hypothetical protein
MTSKETAAEQILAKHLGWDTFSGGSVMCNTSEILAAMKEYGASLQPKEADKDIEIEARERESKFLNERINEQYREIERLKAALDACFGVMMQFTSIGKGKFYTPHKLDGCWIEGKDFHKVAKKILAGYNAAKTTK